MKLISHGSASEFLEVAQDYLELQESCNSLALGLALRCRNSNHPMDEGTKFFTVEEQGVLVGTASQTPGHALLLTSMGEQAAQCVAREVLGHLDVVRGCNGPVDSAEVVASEWSRQGLGDLSVQADLRLFELTELHLPRVAPGALRKAGPEDFEVCQRWAYRFYIDCNLPEATPGRLPERVHPLEQGRMHLWEVDGRPVACAAWSRPVKHGASIGYVYTPDEERGKGYASNMVAALTAGLLEGRFVEPARRHVNLFTDLANPTSNSIYQKLGYRAVADFRHYLFAKEVQLAK